MAKLEHCELMVMDEADKLLSPEFAPLVEQTLAFLGKKRQILAFSATFPLGGMCLVCFEVSLFVDSIRERKREREREVSARYRLILLFQ